jgi:hypothetical protein
MSNYANAAVMAATLINSGEIENPVDAWSIATKKVFPTSESLRKKGCPKGAFLGLCNAGFIKGLDAGQYSIPTKNGEYAVAAVEILKSNRFIASQPDLLWKKAAGPTKTSNNQMDVVVGLWEADCISI